MNDAHFTITIVLVLLLTASGAAMATKWLPVPYTIALVARRLTWGSAMLFAAIISPTDPLRVLALFKKSECPNN